jgi:hypothetical protein
MALLTVIGNEYIEVAWHSQIREIFRKIEGGITAWFRGIFP